jgi:hypothetical protein
MRMGDIPHYAEWDAGSLAFSHPFIISEALWQPEP